MFEIERYHDISCGHRVYGHESQCAHLHGHNYRIFFTVRQKDNELDGIGRVVDFAVIKSKLCQWLEEVWDHKTLIWDEDPILPLLIHIDPKGIVHTSFNPTAENMAQFLVEYVGPRLLKGTGCVLISCRVEETRKCSATYRSS